VARHAPERCQAATLGSRSAQRRAAWLATFAIFFVAAGFRGLFPQFAGQQLRLAPTMVGLYLGLMMLVQTLTFVYLGVLRTHLASGQLLGPSQFGAMLGLLLLTLRSPLWAAVCVILLGIAIGVSFTASQYHSVHGRADAARQSGINEAVVGMGNALGPLACGLAAEELSPLAPWILSAALMAVCVGLARLRGGVDAG
ncbi:MAG: hypothetical protein HUU35_19895, partial [Armatimonadetes bacterium]|nr:hypothetical protein [Armatimonadota bacterium]